MIGTPSVDLVHRTDDPHADLFVRLREVRGDGGSRNHGPRLAPPRRTVCDGDGGLSRLLLPLVDTG